MKNPPMDEAFNPPKDYKNYIGWYITLYVHEIVGMNINLPEVSNKIPCLYLMFSERKPKSIDELGELQVIYEELFSRDRKRLKNCRWLLTQGALRKYPKDLEYLGVCRDFKYPVDEYIESRNVNFIWWNTIELYSIRSYELALKRLRESDE